MKEQNKLIRGKCVAAEASRETIGLSTGGLNEADETDGAE